jgi:hypothetical protein
MIYLCIILFALITAGFIIWDYSYWLKHKAINHNNRFWLRAISFVPVAGWFAYLAGGSYLWALFISLVMVASVFQNLFDGIFNILRGLPWFFPGSDGPEDGKIENLLQKYPWLQWVKVGIAIVSLIIYSILYQQ